MCPSNSIVLGLTSVKQVELFNLRWGTENVSIHFIACSLFRTFNFKLGVFYSLWIETDYIIDITKINQCLIHSFIWNALAYASYDNSVRISQPVTTNGYMAFWNMIIWLEATSFFFWYMSLSLINNSSFKLNLSDGLNSNDVHTRYIPLRYFSIPFYFFVFFLLFCWSAAERIFVWFT